MCLVAPDKQSSTKNNYIWVAYLQFCIYMNTPKWNNNGLFIPDDLENGFSDYLI